MTLPKWHKKIYNAETGEEFIVEYTPQEIVKAEEAQEAFLAEIAVKQAETSAKKAARQAVLSKLGLTAEEAAALLL